MLRRKQREKKFLIIVVGNSLGNDFLEWHQKFNKQAKINKWGHIKLKSFCGAKEAINRLQRQHKEWEKISADHLSDKRLISKIYKKLTQFNQNNKTKFKWGENLKRFFFSQRNHIDSQNKHGKILNFSDNESQNHTSYLLGMLFPKGWEIQMLLRMWIKENPYFPSRINKQSMDYSLMGCSLETCCCC